MRAGGFLGFEAGYGKPVPGRMLDIDFHHFDRYAFALEFRGFFSGIGYGSEGRQIDRPLGAACASGRFFRSLARAMLSAGLGV